MTLQDTFEQSFRQRLLDLIYGQWTTLGAPFAAHADSEDSSVIDPEALVWCSLEFLPTEPRLEETIIEWLIENSHYIVRQRIIKVANHEDPRTLLWQSLDQRKSKSESVIEPSESLYGLSSPAEVVGRRRIRRRNRAAGIPGGLAAFAAQRHFYWARDLLVMTSDIFDCLPSAKPRRKTARCGLGRGLSQLSDAAERWKAPIITLKPDTGCCI
jgi:hypothetical protein